MPCACKIRERKREKRDTIDQDKIAKNDREKAREATRRSHKNPRERHVGEEKEEEDALG